MGKQQKLKEQRRVSRQVQAFDAFHEAKAEKAPPTLGVGGEAPPDLGVNITEVIDMADKFGG